MCPVLSSSQEKTLPFAYPDLVCPQCLAPARGHPGGGTSECSRPQVWLTCCPSSKSPCLCEWSPATLSPSAPCSRVVHKLDLHSGGPLGDMVTEAGKGGWRGREDHNAEDSDLCCKYSWVTQPWGDSEHSQECWLLRSPLEIWALEGTAIRIPSLLNAPLPGSQLGMGPVTFSP